MKKLFLFLLTLIAISVTAAQAQDLVAQYNTYISSNDIENSDGAKITGVGEILQQDRANVYRFGNPDGDPKDDDGFFKTIERREQIPGMFKNGEGIDGKLRKAILSGDAYITVSVYRTGSGRYYIEVERNNA